MSIYIHMDVKAFSEKTEKGDRFHSAKPIIIEIH